MRGKHYDAGKRRVFSSGWYVGVIIAVVVIAALVAITLLVLLPTTEEQKADTPTIVSINYPDGEIGAGANLDLVYFTVEYSNGETAQVALSSMVYEGLDVTADGVQNVSLTYGGYEDTIPIKVKKVDCILSYSASPGGRILGETKQSVVSGGDADTVWAIPETGYTFVGWSDGYPEAERKDKAVNESRSLIANFEMTKFRVTFFYKDGTTNKEELVQYGNAAIKVPDENDPRMDVYGYTFVGWSVSADDYAHVYRDMNIYPRYEKTATDVTCESTVDKNGAPMGSTDADKYGGFFEHSDIAAATITATPKTDRTFLYWEVLSSDGEFVNLGRQSDVGGSKDTTVEIGDNRTQVTFSVRPVGTSAPDNFTVSFYCNDKIDYITLRAQFSYKVSRVDFINYQNKKTNNKEFTLDDVLAEQTIGDRLKEFDTTAANVVIETANNGNKGLPVPEAVTGMEFLGWYVQGDPTQTLVTRDVTVVEPTEFVAKWSPRTYGLIFEYTDEYGRKQQCGDTVYVAYQNTIGSGGGTPAQTPTKDAHIFVGWEDAYTHEDADDTTIVMYRTGYPTESDSDFVKNRIVRYIAKWSPIAHRLNVSVEGEGSVILISRGKETDVIGETDIYEDTKYEAMFTANEGYKVEYVHWTYTSATAEGGQDYFGADGEDQYFSAPLNERADNTLVVSFVPITYNVTIFNGDAYNGGFILLDGTRVNSDIVRGITVNAGGSVSIGIEALNESYAINKIYLTGRADGERYSGTLKYDYEGTAKTATEIMLKDCRSDITVTVEYAGVSCVITVNQTEFTEGTGEYPFMLTTLGGRTDDRTVPEAQTAYMYGNPVFYALQAKEGEYISSVLFNGAKTDLYAGSDSVVFYDWAVNREDLGITLMRIDGEYYYCYGKAGVAAFGEDYLYCQKIHDGTVTIFLVENEAAGEYSLYETASNAPGTGTTVREYLEEELRVAEKDLFDYTLEKDLRVTSVKMMVLPTKNLNLSMTTAAMTYDVVVEDTDFGTVEYTKSTVNPGETVYFSAIPVTGYTIVGYEVNGTLFPVDEIAQGAGIEFTLEHIYADQYVSVRYSVVRYNVVFENTTVRNGNVYVEREVDFGENEIVELQSVGVFTLEYSSHAAFVIYTEEGKVLTGVKIDGVAQEIAYNAGTYRYVNYGVTKAVRVTVSVGEKEVNEPQGSYSVRFNVSDAITPSVKYGAAENEIRLIPAYGYYGVTAGLKGTAGGEAYSQNVDLTALTDNVPVAGTGYTVVKSGGAYVLTLASDAFTGYLDVSCTSQSEQVEVTAENLTPIGGSISGDGTYAFGREVPVTVTAFDGYYIASFSVNGKEIPFVSADWTNKVSPTSDGKYTNGTYSMLVSENASVRVSFAKFTYRVSLDKSSINGTTTFFYNGEDGSGRIQEGESLIISMRADPGYHISRILINGKEAEDYVPYTTVANDNTNHTYTYNGAEGMGVKGDVSVYVVYDINRYGFTYELVNASANFSAESETGNRLECPDARYLGDNRYTDIAYGDNFSINVIPGLSKGYYVYSVTIKYSGYSGGSRTRYAGVDFDENGATLWFNQFLWDNNVAGSVGVTADVELIRVVFKKRMFTLEAKQVGEGTVSYAVSNSLSATGEVFLFDGDDVNAKKYSILNGVVRRETIVDGSSVYVETDIRLKNINGEWVMHSDSEDADYAMFFEYGLRISFSAVPEEGYDRTVFTVNDEDRSGNVFANKYNFNMYRNTVVFVQYDIKTYEIAYRAVAYQANNIVQVPVANLSRYLRTELWINDENDDFVLAAQIEEGKNAFGVTVEYGTKIILKIMPNFEEYGAYLETLYQGATPISLNGFDTRELVVYGGETGFRTTDALSFVATSMVMVYSVTTASAYRWTVGNTEYGEAIQSDSRNTVTVDNSSITTAKPSWSQSASFRLVAGTGYYIANVMIGGGEGIVHMTNYPAVAAQYGTITYYYEKIVRDSGGAIVKDENYRVVTVRQTATLVVDDETWEMTEDGLVYRYNEERVESATNVTYEVEVVFHTTDGTILVRERRAGVDGNFEETIGAVLSGFVVLKDRDDAVYTKKDVLTIYGVKEDKSVTVCFARQDFEIIYAVENAVFLETNGLKTDFNTLNEVLPTRTGETGMALASHYYDEITVTITPKDGYKLTSDTLTVQCVRVLENGSYEVLRDVNGTEQVFTMALRSTGNGDEMSFTYHRSNMAAADRYIFSTIRIEIGLTVKKYALGTTITRVRASGDKSDGGNNTAVKLEVRDQNGNSITVGNSLQSDVIYKIDSTDFDKTAQHHGYVRYSFTTPVGYVLSSFQINGFTLDEMTSSEDPNVRAILMEYHWDKVPVDGASGGGYAYSITLRISTTLIKGSLVTPWARSGGRDIVASFTFSATQYHVNVVFVDEETGESTVGELSTVTGSARYGEMIEVFYSESVSHFGIGSIRPVLGEGYEIVATNNTTDVYFGTKDGVVVAPEYKAGFMQSGKYFDSSVRTGTQTAESLVFSSANLQAADASQGLTYLYFFFRVRIISYTETVSAKVFYSGSEQGVALSEYPDAGMVTVRASRYGEGVGDVVDLSLEAEYRESLEYFSVVTVEAQARAGFAIYGIYEVTVNDKGQTVSTPITGGSKFVSYSVINGRHVVNITVRDTSKSVILGNRTFRVDFKQEAVVTVKVTNPYKYITGNRRYVSYVGLTAYTSENPMTDGVPSASLAVPNRNVGTAVVEEYEFVVYVGNYVKFVVNDTYANLPASGTFYTTDLRATNGDPFEGNPVDIGNRSTGKVIAAPREDYNLYVETPSRIAATRSSVGAVAGAVGGTLTLSGATTSATTTAGTTTDLMNEETVVGQRITMTVTPSENYVFYAMRVRQINRTRTMQQGFVVFETTDALMYNSLTRDQVADADEIDNFNEKESSGMKVIDVVVSGDRFTFTFWVCGNAEIYVEFYRTYNVTTGVYYTDRVAERLPSAIASLKEKVGIASGADTPDTLRKDALDSVLNHTDLQVVSLTDNIFAADLSDEAMQAMYASLLKPARRATYEAGDETHFTRMSYGASVELSVDKPAGDYQFVGWYANNYDLYTYLSTLLPIEESRREKITLTVTDMPSLVNGTSEASEVCIYAVFQPVIDVSVYNEKFYAYETHFNSWDLATIVTTYYPFERRVGNNESSGRIYSTQDVSLIRDSSGRNIPQTKNYLMESQAYAHGNGWSALLSSTDTNGDHANYNTTLYDSTMLNNRVYSSYDEFTVLYQNIADGDFYTFSWTNTKIDLSLTNLSATATFQAWQYFNWSTQTWMDITYSYEDEALGLTTDGNPIVVDCYDSNFSLNLEALYTYPEGSSTVYMPYAISATSANNLQTRAEDCRPLLLRADLYQTVTIELAQCLFASDLGGEDPEQTKMPESLVRPSVQTDSIKHTTSALRSITDGMKGSYEYGTVISLRNNTDNPGENILVGNNIRYRFLGWFIRYNKTLYYINGSEYEASFNPDLRVNLICQSDKQNTQLAFIAIYVRQFRQTVYSYNISGAGDGSMKGATASGGSSGDASPELTITTKLQSTQSSPSGIAFRYLDVDYTTIGEDTYGTINFYDLSKSMAKYYYINDANESETVQDGNGVSHVLKNKRVNANGEFFTRTGRELTYFFDVGCQFYVDMPDSAAYGETTLADVKSSHAKGFCPDTDTLFTYIKNGSNTATKEVIADYSTYYNSGKGTYYDGTRCLTAADMKARIYDNASIRHVLNGLEDTQRTNQYDLVYISTATLIFYNLTYKGGVSVPASMAKLLSGGASTVLTVWDEVSTYGDYATINNAGSQVNQGANGEVVIRISLVQYSSTYRKYVGITDRGFQGTYKFAFAGMRVGEGFPTRSEITGPSSNGLFTPSRDTAHTFTRWYEIDLSVKATTYLFGKTSYSTENYNAQKVGMHTATGYKYTTQNVGDAHNGYYVTSVSQLKNIDAFWKNNDHSCVGVTVPANFTYINEEGTVLMNDDGMWMDRDNAVYTTNFADYYGKTRFVLTKDAKYNLQSLTLTGARANPAGTTTEWVPMCDEQSKWSATRNLYGTNLYPECYYGFDGILEGNNAIIQGIAVSSSGASWFGLFASVSGGEVFGLRLDNAYINAEAEYAGVIAGHCEYATFRDISCEAINTYAIYNDGTFIATTSAGTRTMIYARKGAGIVAGYMFNCSLSSITVKVSSSAAYGIEITGNDSAGAMVGQFCGELGNASNLTLDNPGNSGSAWLLVRGSTNSGGMLGYVYDGALVNSVTVNSNMNMAIGASNVRYAGGIIGQLQDSTLSNVQFFGAKNDTFSYSEDDSAIGGRGLYLLAKPSSVSSDATASNNNNGSAGGLVGFNNAGLVTNAATYATVEGVFKTYAGTAGGLVGANSGRVTGFSLRTGYSGSYIGLTMLVRVKYDGQTGDSFNFGGAVGANLGTGKQTSPSLANAATFNGMVDDITFVGYSSMSDDNTYWQQSGVYAFVDGGSSATRFTSTTFRSISTGEAGSPLTMNGEQTYYIMNINLGGVVGYSRGSILNCSVQYNKLTFNVQTNGSPNASNNSFYSGKGDKYAWSILAGMIVGYFEPSVIATKGISTMFDLPFNSESTPITTESMGAFLKKNDFFGGRVQSCYVKNAYIVVVGRAYLDNSKMGTSRIGGETYKTGVAMAGIAGGSGSKATGDYSVNSVLVSNLTLVFAVTPAGSGSMPSAWNNYTKEETLDLVGLKKKKVYYVEGRNVFYQVELRMDPILAGLFTSKDCNDTFTFTHSGAKVRYTTSCDHLGKDWWQRSTSKSGWFSGSNGSYPDTSTNRLTRYALSGSEGGGAAMPSGSNREALPGFSTGSASTGGIYNAMDNGSEMFTLSGSVVATDMTTGFLKYVRYASYTIKIGATPTATASGYIATVDYGGKKWSFYYKDLITSGYDSPSASNFAVR